MATPYRAVGSLESTDLLASTSDVAAAYMEFDSASGTARFGAKGPGGSNLGVAIRTMLAGVITDALSFAANAAATFAAAVTVAAGGLKSISNATALTLAYDATHAVAFAVSSTGGLTITPEVGQAVTVPTFAATGKATLSAQTSVGDLFRVASIAAPDTSGLTGGGVEISYSAGVGNLKAYDYTAAALKPLRIDASTIGIGAAPIASALIWMGANSVASGGTGYHLAIGSNSVAAANNDNLNDFELVTTLDPGAFTNLTWRLLHINPQGLVGGRTGTVSTMYGIDLQDVNLGTVDNYAIFTRAGVVSLGDELVIRSGGLSHSGNLGFYGTAPIARPTVTGSRGGNAAIASLITQGQNLGLWIDGTTA